MRWFPLESNPDVMNDYIKELGCVDGKVEIVDVYGLSEEFLGMVPRPIHAFLLVYPITEKTEAYTKSLTDSQKDEIKVFREEHKDLFYTKQYVSNACGTIALLHALLNNWNALGNVPDSSILGTLRQKCLHESDQKRGEIIEKFEDLGKAHQNAAAEGHTQNQDIEVDIDLHFVCILHVGGRCVELDGRQENVILHGKCSDNDSFVAESAKVIQDRMNLKPGSYEFNITALVDSV